MRTRSAARPERSGPTAANTARWRSLIDQIVELDGFESAPVLKR